MTTRGPRSMVAAVVGGQLLAGVVAGVLWRLWSPATVAYVVAGSGRTPIVIPDESESQIAADGRYLLLCAVIGLTAGLTTWRLRRLRGVLGVASVTVGALLGAAVTWQVGCALATGKHTGAVDTAIRLPLTLHATALVSAQALIAVISYVLATGLSDDELKFGPAVDLQAQPLPAG